MEKLRIDLEDENLRLRFTKIQYIGEEEMEYLSPRENCLPIMMTSLIGRNYLCAPMSVYFNAYRDNAYNRGGEEILKVEY